MRELTYSELSLVNMMGKTDELANHGFRLILKRSDPVRFLEPLMAKGFFSAERNPSPVMVDGERYYQVPYWNALDYLLACAKFAGTDEDLALGNEIMKIVRCVSDGSASSESKDNFHTWRVFAEIIGTLPIGSVRMDDIGYVRRWLTTRFDRSLVVKALDEGALSRWLDEDGTTPLRMALELVGYCTEVRWETTKYIAEGEEPVAVVDEYWLNELIQHHAAALGKRAGRAAASLFKERVREVYGRGDRPSRSYSIRAAVEEDAQNYDGKSVENCVVIGLRDVLLGWCDSDPSGTRSFVQLLIRNENEMLRRIGIYVLRQQWSELRAIYYPIATPQLFQIGHLHELYGLLRERFETFTDREKEATMEAIRKLAVTIEHRDEHQYRWLNAIVGTKYAPAAQWIAKLSKKFRETPHPDYVLFSEARWGPGPSHYTMQQLASFADDRSIGKRLAAAKQGDPWEGPTIEALVDELQSAVAAAPITFVDAIPEFLSLSIQYQYGLLRGYLDGWRASEPSSDWNRIWISLFSFFGSVLSDPGFLTIDETDISGVQPSSITGVIGELLDYGTRDDKHAYPDNLLSDGWSLIQILVKLGEPMAEPGENPMDQAINAPRGRAYEAAFSHILRRCRSADKRLGSHDTVWSDVRGFIDRQLADCTDGNFEFSTLCGAYIGNLKYMNADWLKRNITKIFPADHSTNLQCAIGGLAYAPADREIYRILRDAGVMDDAIRLEDQGRHVRGKLMERLMIGYLWGEETLTTSRLRTLFRIGRSGDFESISGFFRSIRGEALDADQVNRVVEYWRCCVKWARGRTRTPTAMLAGLSELAAFLGTAKGNQDLLQAVAPHVRENRELYDFIGELNRLVEGSAGEICGVVACVIDTHGSFYDYEGRMRTLLERLAAVGYRTEVLGFCEALHSMAGIDTLYNQLGPGAVEG